MKRSAWGLTMAAGVVAGLASWPALAQPQDEAVGPGQLVAGAYGLDSWDLVASLDFTFHVTLPDKTQVVREWRWQPKSNQVERLGGQVTKPGGAAVELPAVTFTTGAVADDVDAALKEADGQFINDVYWLLFPFQLVWSNPTVTMGEMAEQTPIGGGLALKVTAQWPNEGGYTPGDAYDLYLDERGLIDQWVYRKGGASGAASGGADGKPATWEKHVQLGPIIVSLDHKGPADSGFHLWFSDVRATLHDGTTVNTEAMAEP